MLSTKNLTQFQGFRTVIATVGIFVLTSCYSLATENWVQRTGAIGNRGWNSSFFSATPTTGGDLRFRDYDGDLDLDLLHAISGDLYLHRNEGTTSNPSWAARELLTEASQLTNPADIGYADIDQDGDHDLTFITTDHFDALYWLENTGSRAAPAFTEAEQPLVPFSLINATWLSLPDHALSDVDQDGDIDVFFMLKVSAPGVGTINQDIKILFFENVSTNQTPSWSSSVDVAQLSDAGVSLETQTTFFGNLHLHDIDNDQDDDLLLSMKYETGSSFVEKLFMTPNTGTPAAPIWGPPEEALAPNFHSPELSDRTFALGDLDDDGDLDWYSRTGYYQANNSPGTTDWYPSNFSFFGLSREQISKPEICDLDANGLPDLLFSSNAIEGGKTIITLLLNKGTLATPAWEIDQTQSTLTGPSSSRTAAMDIDGDQDVDLIHFANNQAQFSRNIGTPTAPQFASAEDIPNGWTLPISGATTVFDAGDIDNDGDDDVVRFNNGPDTIDIFINQPSGMHPVFSLDHSLDYDALFPGRFPISLSLKSTEQDGLLDLVFITRDGSHDHQLGIIKNTGTPTIPVWTNVLVSSLVVDNFAYADVDDLDADGNLDAILGRAGGHLEHYERTPSSLSLSESAISTAVGTSIPITATEPSANTFWQFISNGSSGSINPTNGLYTAGSTPGVDIVEAVAADGRKGRVFINVLDAQDITASGKAIIIAGANASDDPVFPAVDRIARKAYDLLRIKGFAKDNIEYLSFETGIDVDGDGQEDTDGFASHANVQQAFTTFLDDAEQVFVFMVDHGAATVNGAGVMRLNPSELLTASEVDGWLDTWQGANPTGAVSLVLDFCYAGAWLDEMTDATSNRMTLASCATNELAYFIANGLVSFSDVFLSGLLQGQDLAGAFNIARGAMSNYQQAQLDDNLDGIFNPDEDGLRAADRKIGASVSVGRDIPQIGEIPVNTQIDGPERVELYAGNIVSPYAIERVWAVVVPPNHAPDPNEPNPVIDLPEINLFYNPNTDRYEAEYGGFNQAGSYAIIYFAQDIWGGVSFPKQTYINQGGFTEKALVFAGGNTNAPNWSAIEFLGNATTATLLSRQIPSNNIRQYTPADLPTATTVETNLSNWASDAEIIDLLFIGEATSNEFHLTASERLTATQLATILNLYQATNQTVRVLLDFSGSGSWVQTLAPSNNLDRLVVASSASGRESVLTESVSLTGFLMDELLAGKSINQGLQLARRALRRASGPVRQNVQIDDNGDGIANTKNTDPDTAVLDFIGTPFVTGEDLPTIGQVVPPSILNTGVTQALLWADDVIDADNIASVVCQISAPTNTLDNLSIEIPLATNALTGRWEAEYDGFIQQGLHSLLFIATDTTGTSSHGVSSSVFQPNNLPAPSAFGDTYEIDNAFTNAVYGDLPIVQHHSLHTSNDCDWVKFFASSNFIYDIETTHLSTNIDTRIRLYYQSTNNTPEFIAEIDDFGNDLGELIGLDFPETGYYFIEVCQATNGLYTPGEYILSIYTPAGPEGLLVFAWDPIHNQPIANAIVTVTPSSPQRPSLPTTSAGFVQYANTPPGDYTVNVTPPAIQQYLPLFGPNNECEVHTKPGFAYGNPRIIDRDNFAEITYRNNSREQIGAVAFGFLPLYRFTGHVTDSQTGEPVKFANLKFLESASTGFNRYPWYFGQPNWQSQADGSFPENVYLPPNGSYTLVVTGEDHGYENHEVTISTGSPNLLGNPDQQVQLIPRFTDGFIPDPWKITYGLSVDTSPDFDSDQDGQSDGSEYVAGTIPSLPASYFGWYTISDDHFTQMRISWTMIPDRTYHVLRSETFDNPASWELVLSTTNTNDSARVVSYPIPTNDAPDKLYYKLDVEWDGP